MSSQGFWAMLTADQKAGIEAIIMDMWDPFVNSVKTNIPNVEEKIVFDKYHIASNLGHAVDLVWRGEKKALRTAGDDSLVGTKYDWLIILKTSRLKPGASLPHYERAV